MHDSNPSIRINQSNENHSTDQTQLHQHEVLSIAHPLFQQEDDLIEEHTLQDVLFLECFASLKAMIQSFDPASTQGKELLSIIGQLCTDEQLISILNSWLMHDPTFLSRYARFMVLTIILGYDLGIQDDRLLMLGHTALFYVPSELWNLLQATTEFITLYDNRLRAELTRLNLDRYSTMDLSMLENQ